MVVLDFLYWSVCNLFFSDCNPGYGNLNFGVCPTNVGSNITAVDMNDNLGVWYVQARTKHFWYEFMDRCTRIYIQPDSENSIAGELDAYSIKSYTNV